MATNENITYLPNEQVTSPPVSRRTKAVGFIGSIMTASLLVSGALEKNPDLGGNLIATGLYSGIAYGAVALGSEVLSRQKIWKRGRSAAVRHTINRMVSDSPEPDRVNSTRASLIAVGTDTSYVLCSGVSEASTFETPTGTVVYTDVRS